MTFLYSNTTTIKYIVDLVLTNYIVPRLLKDIDISISFFYFLHSTIITAGKLVISNIIVRGILIELRIDYY